MKSLKITLAFVFKHSYEFQHQIQESLKEPQPECESDEKQENQRAEMLAQINNRFLNLKEGNSLSNAT